MRIRRAADRGHADHGWLDTWHTFSFAEYRDPAHMGFGPLRVLNQDRVQGGRGFGRHPHDNMEIVSFVLDGVLQHQDSLGNGSRLRPGDVQLLSAGTGVVHSEWNGSDDDDVHFLQMWVLPAARDTAPRYQERHFPEGERRGRLRLVVAPDGRDGALTIGQDARMYAGLFDGAETAALPLAEGRGAWVHVARGEVLVDGETLAPGDAAALRGPGGLELSRGRAAEVVVWDVPVSGI